MATVLSITLTFLAAVVSGGGPAPTVVDDRGAPSGDSQSFVRPVSVVPLTAEESKSFLTGMSAELGVVTSLEASFLQQRRMAVFDQTLTAKGKCYFVAPNKLRWELVEPYPSALVYDDGKIAKIVYDKGKAKELNPGAKGIMREVLGFIIQWMQGNLGGSDRFFDMMILRQEQSVLRVRSLSSGEHKRKEDVMASSPAADLYYLTEGRVDRLELRLGDVFIILHREEAQRFLDLGIQARELDKDKLESLAQIRNVILSHNTKQQAEPGQLRGMLELEQRTIVRLVPKHEELREALDSIELVCSADKQVRRVLLYESDGDRVIISYYDETLNPRLDPSLFIIP